MCSTFNLGVYRLCGPVCPAQPHGRVLAASELHLTAIEGIIMRNNEVTITYSTVNGLTPAEAQKLMEYITAFSRASEGGETQQFFGTFWINLMLLQLDSEVVTLMWRSDPAELIERTIKTARECITFLEYASFRRVEPEDEDGWYWWLHDLKGMMGHRAFRDHLEHEWRNFSALDEPQRLH